MGERIRSFAWSKTSLGAPALWPQALRTLVELILNSKQPMFLVWGPERIWLYNDAFIPIAGRKHPASLGQASQDVWAEAWTDLEPLFDRVFAGEPVHMTDFSVGLDRSGSIDEAYFDFSYTPIRGDGDIVQGLFGVCIETTERVRQEGRQVAAAEVERDRIFEMSRDLFAVASFDGYLKSINPAWSRQLGRSTEELLAQPFSEIIHPDDLALTGDVIAALRSGRAVHQFHVRLLKADGAGIAFAWSAVPEAALESGRFYTVGRDITEDLQREEALRQGQKMEAVGQLTGGVAHDFNNLLTVIKSSTDLLKRPDLPEERRQRYIGAISETVDRAAKLTGQLLAFARRQALQPEVFEVSQSVKAIGGMVSTITGSRIAIVTQLPGQPCFVSADPSQFDTAVVNLVVNARDAMDGEGQLTIEVCAVEGIPAMREHPSVPGSFVAVVVSDNGTGIRPDMMERIFEPFFTTKGVGQGTGLGLSQVFGFTKQSEGEVRVESELGVGTTFTLYLPQVAGKASGVVEREPEPLMDGHGTRVLMVEDNREVGAFAVQTLAELGYGAIWVANAEEALAELVQDADRFDVVFSDVVMPGMGGAELGQEIGRLYPDLPVVLTSGYSHVLAQNGTSGFELLHKPYSVEQLSRILRKAAASQRRRPGAGIS